MSLTFELVLPKSVLASYLMAKTGRQSQRREETPKTTITKSMGLEVG